MGKTRVPVVGSYDNAARLFEYSPLSPTGNLFFVNSATGSNAVGYGRSPDAPFASLAYAFSSDVLTADNDDHVFIAPGHAESVGAASAIAMDIAGVTVVGLGNGNKRPLFTLGTVASATIAISAANITFKNVQIKTSVDELVKAIVITAAHCTLDGVDFVDNASTAQCLQFANVSAAGDYFTMKNCFHYQSVAANTAQKWIELVGCDCARILDNTFMILANASTSSQLIAGTTAVVNCVIARNLMLWTGATVNTVVNLVTGSTGIISDNRAGSGTSVATAGAFTGDGCFMFENRWADTAAASGLLAPAADTDT